MSAGRDSVGNLLGGLLDDDGEPEVEPQPAPAPAPPSVARKVPRKSAPSKPKAAAPAVEPQEPSEVDSYLHTVVAFDPLVKELRARAAARTKKRGPRKAQMNSQISIEVIDQFDDWCEALEYPRQVVLEQLMRAAIASKPELLG